MSGPVEPHGQPRPRSASDAPRAREAIVRRLQEARSGVVLLGSASLVALSLLLNPTLSAVRGRTAIEMVIALLALLTITLLTWQVSARRPVDALPLLVAVAIVSLTDIFASVLPELIGSRDGVALTGCQALAAAVLVVAAAAFLVRPTRDRHERALMAGASLLLAGVQLDEISHPLLTGAGLSATCVLRLLAFGLLLVVALRRRRQLHADRIHAAVGRERQRIARDLHDGLAQDLAFIVAYAQRRESELGPEHPLIIAASRALAVSRGALVDLSASDADCTGGALRDVARELARRFEVAIDVTVEDQGASADGLKLDAVRREEIVRIAREAVVNAVRHGGARRIDIVLSRRGDEIVLRVRDDGSGARPEALHRRHGFGLPTMRARARALGGRLTVGAGSCGGTEVAVLVPGRDGRRRARLVGIRGHRPTSSDQERVRPPK